MNRCILIIATTFGLMPVAAAALSLEFPSNAIQTATQSEALGAISVPIGPFTNGNVQAIAAKGALHEQSWRLPDTSLSTLQIIEPLRQQLLENGYAVMLDCVDIKCGGFDFRYELSLLPEPDMHVDLGDFRFLSVRKSIENKADAYVTLMVSRSENSGFVQLTSVGSTDALVTPTGSIPRSITTVTTASAQGLAQALETIGRSSLEDLTFKTGSASLGDESFSSLDELASYLRANTDKTVALVGHTDSQGSLSNNIALSRKRAAAVLERLVSKHEIPRRQLESDGVGYLSPRASNISEDGRTQNRRVEVILTSTQ